MIAALVISMLTAATAQNSRPRYSQGQYGEQTWTVPDDTIISVNINGSLSSKTSRVGDRFTATVTAPVYVNGRTVIPAGAIVEGRVVQVTPARRMGKSGAIAIDFDDLVFPNGSRINIEGNLTSDDPETRRRIDEESRVSGERNGRGAVFIGSSGAIGAVLGAITGGSKGAAVGGILGAGAGAAAVLLSKGEEARVPSGTPFGIQLRQPLVIRESFLDEGGNTASNNPSPVDRQPDYSTSNEPAADRQPENTQPDQPQPDSPREPATDAQPGMPTTDTADSGVADQPLPLSSPEMIRRAQIALKEQGYYEGATDGAMSARVTNALKTYQREHKLAETGELDPQTARSLGILGSASVSDRPTNPTPRDTTGRSPSNSGSTSTGANVVLANVLSATAMRTADGAINVVIETQANTGGWKWYGDHVVNGDTLEVYARAVRPTGIVTQALTRGRIELTVRDRVEYVRRVVVHSASGDQPIPLTSNRATVPSAPPVTRTSIASSSSLVAMNIQRQAEDLLSEYQRIYGVRLTGTNIEITNAARYREAEIELLFAIDSFANSAQLYARLVGSLQDRQAMRSATLAMARQARRTDRVISTSTSPLIDPLAGKWDLIRQDVLRLMQSFNISTSELDN